MLSIDDPWREHVELLWGLLDQVVSEEASPAVVHSADQLVEWARSFRLGDRADFPTENQDETGDLVRILVERMRLQNLAEDLGRVELVKIRRGRLKQPPRGSVDVLSQRLHETPPADYTSDLEGHLVLTVHPTESTRRTVLQHIRNLALTVEVGDDKQGQARDIWKASVKESLRALWRTSPQRTNRPRVRDEVELGIFYVSATLFNTLPEVQNAVNAVLQPTSGARIDWHVDSWIGGDRDGHPFVDAEVTRYTLIRHRQTALGLYSEAVRHLEHVLSADERFVHESDRCQRWLQDAGGQFPEAFQELQTRYTDEPLRQMVGLIASKLDATSRDENRGYATAHAFLQDVRLLGMCWDTNPSRWPSDLQRLVTQGQMFGFHLATLDLRQHSRVQAVAMTEILGTSYDGLEESEKIRALEAVITQPRPWVPATKVTQDLYDTLTVARDFRRRYGTHVVQRFLVSMAHAPSDILAVMALIEAVDPELDLAVVPVVETLNDLTGAPKVLDRLAEVPAWQEAVARHHGTQEIMLGYSDSTKDRGVFAASWAIYNAQRQLTLWGHDHNVRIGFFHGRGGALGRGGGPTSLAIMAQPAGTLDGSFRLTQQGEVLSQKLLLPAVAYRSLELMCTAHAMAGLYPEPDPGRDVHAMMEAAADQAGRQYRSLIDAPGFWDYFLAVTPIREMAQLNWGSRPSWREQFQFEDLRAIPWVFSWSQNRMGIPAWYGAGTALTYLISHMGLSEVQRLGEEWPFLATFLHNLQLALIKSDMQAAQDYQALAPQELSQRFWTEITRERESLRTALREIFGTDELLTDRPRLKRSALWRNPLVDVLNHFQVQLLSMYRNNGDETLLPLLAQTMEGIALGVRNSG